MHRLWFTNAATGWDEALPIGNGRIGAMCFGRPVRDLIQINDDRGWSGGPHSEYQHGKVSADAARDALVAARAALAAGDHATAATELQRLQERYTQSFLPFVDLEVTVDGDMVEQYGRELDLRTGIHTQNYLLDGHHFQQISFASQPAQALIMAIESDAPKGVDVTIALTTPLREIARIPNSDGFALEVRFPSDVAPPHEPSEPAAQWDCATQSALEGAAIIAVSHDGTLVASDERGIAVTGARSIVVVVTTASTFRGSRLPLAESLEPLRREATDRARRQLARGFDRLRDEHIEDHAILYARTEISLPGTRKPIPTNMRLQEAIDDVEAGCDVDPFLIGLLFHYGRYLLIASSRAGTLPANLQGLWNDRLQPPWSSNYTININTQMNYWGADVGNLRELQEPLFDFVDNLAQAGKDTARRLYDAPGWVAHHNSDAWAYTSSVGMAHGDVSWAWWPMGGAWLVTHFARHLEFGWDQKFARDRAWPAAAGCAAFLLSWIERRTDGTLGTPIATSPENNFVLSDGARGSVAAASTMDLALIRDVFRLVQDLDKRLALNSPIARRCAESLPQLLAPPMDPDGRIREWPDGFPDWEPHHRHVSHLYGLYPGVERWTDQLREGARKSLDSRGNDASGWSLTWKLALRARLGQSNVVQQLLRLFFRTPDLSKNDSAGSLQPNLLQTSPPFQIDANLGLVGALAEMFVQSHLGVIELLPALPSTFTSGAVRGLVARPGVIVDFGWAAGRLTFATLTSRQDVDVRVDWPGGGAHLRLLAGDSTALKIGS